jgi:hypothetical protein
VVITIFPLFNRLNVSAFAQRKNQTEVRPWSAMEVGADGSIRGPLPTNVDVTQNDGTTGRFLGAGEKRTLQLALKFNF